MKEEGHRQADDRADEEEGEDEFLLELDVLVRTREEPESQEEEGQAA